MPSPRGLRIGEVARRTATSPRSLRYYEQQGLVRADRDHNGYRRYDDDAVTAIRNLRRLLDAGLSLHEIRQFGSCVRAPDIDASPCTSALEVYEGRLQALDARISTLQHLRSRVAAETAALRGRLAQAPGS